MYAPVGVSRTREFNRCLLQVYEGCTYLFSTLQALLGLESAGAAPYSTEVAAPILLLESSAAGHVRLGGCCGSEQHCWLTNQLSDMWVVKLLHACSLPQELLNVSGGEDVRWKKRSL